MDESKMPNFYLASTEGYGLEIPRKCWCLQKLETSQRKDLLLIKVEPPIIYENLPYNEVVIASRHQGYSVLSISEWPMYVTIGLIDTLKSNTVEDQNLITIAWGELYKTEKGAMNAMRHQ